MRDPQPWQGGSVVDFVVRLATTVVLACSPKAELLGFTKQIPGEICSTPQSRTDPWSRLSE
jgi:FlaG/FlaF family flagellin (archaellin)